MTRHCVLLALAFAACVGVSSCAEGQEPLTLNIDILKPSPPITISDVVRLRALTSEYVFPSTAYRIESSLVVDGFDIDWDIYSQLTHGIGSCVVCRMGQICELGPLPTGEYQLTVTWTHLGNDLPAWSPASSGIGAARFTVVPEPSAGMMLVAVVGTMMCLRRRP